MSDSWWTRSMIDPDKMIRWQGRARAIVPFLAVALAILDLASGDKTGALFYAVLAVAGVWQWKAGLRHSNKHNSSAHRQRHLSHMITCVLWIGFSVGIAALAILEGRMTIGIITLSFCAPLVALLARNIVRERGTLKGSPDEPATEPL